MKGFQSFVALFVVALFCATHSQAGPSESCYVGKLNLTGKYLACRLKADGYALKNNLTADYTKCEATFNTKFPATEVKAANAGSLCFSVDDVAVIKQKIDAVENTVNALLLPYNRIESTGLTIIDHLTELEWEDKVLGAPGMDYSNPNDTNNTYTWCQGNSTTCDDPTNPPDGTVFTDFLGKLNGSGTGVCFAGHCDWRLPTAAEAATIVLVDDYQPFANSYYWCGETYSGATGEAWNFYTFQSPVHTPKGNALFARAVRGGS